MEKLSPRKAAYVRGRLDGKSKKQAALDAGYSETMAEHASDKIETKDVREAFAVLIRAIIPPEKIVQAIAEGISATETKFFSHEGVVQDQREVPAWGERRQYLEIAAEYGGYYKPAKGEAGAGSGRVILILPGQALATTISGAVIDGTREAAGSQKSLPEAEEENPTNGDVEEGDG